ncbi:MAG: hypothetical protein KatS3mg011_0592 [Acidimicrobiia bacterium]|nr:MAG: hypothetical protein KatS3mg011_0592 [Acidimicrobiia bacterium]
MATTISMPQLGETVTEGTILRWLKRVGDRVEPDEVLVEISTDKVDTEVPSPVGGVVTEILVGEGETVPVGTPLCVIGDQGETTDEGDRPKEVPVSKEAPATARSTAAEFELAAAPAERPKEVSSGRLLSPVVRRLVREFGVDLSEVRGSGRGGSGYSAGCGGVFGGSGGGWGGGFCSVRGCRGSCRRGSGRGCCGGCCCSCW